MFHENSPLQVIHLVLQTDGEQTVRLYRFLGTFSIQIPYDDVLRTLYLVVDAGHRKATLFANLDTVAFYQLGIDQNKQFVPRFGDIDDDNPQVNIDLRRCKSDAWSFIHCLRHIARQTAYAVVNLFDLRRDSFQSWIGITQYR